MKQLKITMGDDAEAEAAKDWWVPGKNSKPIDETVPPFFTFEPKNVVRHMRYGKADTVRGVNLMNEGHYRVEYKISSAAHSSSGFGIVVGVTDAEAPAWKDGDKPAVPDADAEREAVASKLKLIKQTCAWGLCLSSGRLIETLDPHKGRFDGARVGEPLIDRKSLCESAVGMTVAIECEIPVHNTVESRLVASHNYAPALHPLGVNRNYPLHMQELQRRSLGANVAQPSWLSFSINGGEMIRTNVRLPACGVYPWVLLTGEGDEVVCMSFKKLSAEF